MGDADDLLRRLMDTIDQMDVLIRLLQAEITALEHAAEHGEDEQRSSKGE